MDATRVCFSRWAHRNDDVVAAFGDRSRTGIFAAVFEFEFKFAFVCDLSRTLTFGRGSLTGVLDRAEPNLRAVTAAFDTHLKHRAAVLITFVHGFASELPVRCARRKGEHDCPEE